MSAPLIVILIHCFPLEDLVRRHAGVLGLSACILSSPYDVPTWMPQLLMDLSAHLNDTQPIEVSAFAAITLLVLQGGAHNSCSSPDDREENTVKLQADTPRQLAAA